MARTPRIALQERTADLDRSAAPCGGPPVRAAVSCGAAERGGIRKQHAAILDATVHGAVGKAARLLEDNWMRGLRRVEYGVFDETHRPVPSLRPRSRSRRGAGA